MNFTLIIGVLGLISLLVGLFLNLFKFIKEDSKSYLLLNILGGLCLFYYSYSLGSLHFMILQATWTILPAYKFIMILLKK